MSAGRAPSLPDLCHELSQPLTAARGNLELALRLPPEDPDRAGLFAEALAALDRVGELIQSLRDAVEHSGSNSVSD
ncbi:MAG: histidine kinase dimerization/phospho-acceptor domain-containing protein [Terriglobales bacterium]